MANPKHVAILEQGVEVWNKWREENREIRPDLSEISFDSENFTLYNFSGIDLTNTSIKKCNLIGAKLGKWIFSSDILTPSGLGVFTSQGVIMEDTAFIESVISNLIIDSPVTSNVKFQNCRISGSTFINLDFRQIQGLETTRHRGPSFIGIDCFYKSQGKIPEVFLRGAGVPDSMITFMKSLTHEDVIQFYTCFISYSSKDSEFTEKLYDDLQKEGVRVWYAPEDLKIGDKTMPTIDRAIRIRDKLMIVLSENSIESNWVEREVETAEAEELATGKNILFPIRIDDAVMKTDKDWAQRIRKTRHIGDFREWEDTDAYQAAFDRLLRDLREEGTEDE